MELAVDVTADFDGRLELEEDGLLEEDFAGAHAEVADLVLLEHDGFAGAVAAHYRRWSAQLVRVDFMQAHLRAACQ